MQQGRLRTEASTSDSESSELDCLQTSQTGLFKGPTPAQKLRGAGAESGKNSPGQGQREEPTGRPPKEGERDSCGVGYNEISGDGDKKIVMFEVDVADPTDTSVLHSADGATCSPPKPPQTSKTPIIVPELIKSTGNAGLEAAMPDPMEATTFPRQHPPTSSSSLASETDEPSVAPVPAPSRSLLRSQTATSPDWKTDNRAASKQCQGARGQGWWGVRRECGEQEPEQSLALAPSRGGDDEDGSDIYNAAGGHSRCGSEEDGRDQRVDVAPSEATKPTKRAVGGETEGDWRTRCKAAALPEILQVGKLHPIRGHVSLHVLGRCLFATVCVCEFPGPCAFAHVRTCAHSNVYTSASICAGTAGPSQNPEVCHLGAMRATRLGCDGQRRSHPMTITRTRRSWNAAEAASAASIGRVKKLSVRVLFRLFRLVESGTPASVMVRIGRPLPVVFKSQVLVMAVKEERWQDSTMEGRGGEGGGGGQGGRFVDQT